jgi:hypothetical protein
VRVAGVLAAGYRGADQLRDRAGGLQVGLVGHAVQHEVPGGGKPARELAAAVHDERDVEVAARDGDRNRDLGEAVPGRSPLGGSRNNSCAALSWCDRP